MGDSSELVVLWESEEGLTLYRFLLLVDLVALVLVSPVGVLRVEVCGQAVRAASVDCGDGVVVRT